MNAEMSMVMKRTEEREALRNVIHQWNANRLDLFELSEPNEDLDFHGVMRFYFQDSGQKVATKCIRVASDATAQDVIETLIEKFRPDMRMLSLPEYALFEIHENGEERRLSMDEKPLLVQLNWHKDDREGRFLLRNIDEKTNIPSNTFQESGSSFRRKLSKREKKQLKRQEKLKHAIANDENDTKVAEKLYTELPETSFTRSISNPEAVMRRRRQQILERKLQQFRSKDGGPDTGGTLKIYGESLCRDVPYKTLLLSIRDNAQHVVKEMLAKYGLDKEDPHNYCLLQVNLSENGKENSNNNNNNISNQEYILDDDECPLAILMNQTESQGSIMFHVRRRPADYHPRKRKKKPQQKWSHQPSNELLEYRYEDGIDRLPFFYELNPDGSDVNGSNAKRHRLHPNVTEVGNEQITSQGQTCQYLQLFGPNIQARHCVIANTEGIVTVTPCSRDAETYVNGQRIYETTILQHGAIVKFGRIHCFRFLDPCYEERIRQRHEPPRNIQNYSYERQSPRDDTSPTGRNLSTGQNADTQSTHNNNYETTFDVDGNIETKSTSSQGNKDDTRSQRSIGSSSREGNRLPTNVYQRVGTDPILPAVLEIREESEEALLHALITDLDPITPSFKLAPAYCLYLMARYRASTHYRPELVPTERAHRLTIMLARVAAIIHHVIQDRYCDMKSLAFWLANSSELLNFLKSDRHISAFSLDAQDTLADAVQVSFRHLVGCVHSELSTCMPYFFMDKDDPPYDNEESPSSSVLGVLAPTMALLRRCRMNAALTIQLFSQFFHFINVWAFNRIVASNTNYCSRKWGLRLKARLSQIEAWAERQGLELAADCHLARIVQTAHLLQAPKYTGEDLAAISSKCFKLNSLQLRALLMKYQTAPDEPPLPHDLIDNVVRVAENLADELARSDGREVKLEEEQELALPFLLPDDGYSCDVVRGIPQGLIEFVAPLQQAGLCRLSAQLNSNGLWTVYMTHMNATMARSPSAMSNRSAGFVPGQQDPEIQTIKLHKSNNGMGLSIVAAKGAGQDRLGIYIKSVVKGGAADADGRLQAGDQLLKVDGQSLVGITQEKAAEHLVRTGPIVTLEVAKQGAIYHGLATLLSQPSPVMSRGGRRMSERDLPSRVQTDQQVRGSHLQMHPPQMHTSKSVPSLNSTGVSDGQNVGNRSMLGNRSMQHQQPVFNSTTYSRTSSTNSIPPISQNTLRSRSSQNMNDGRMSVNNNRQSNPNLLQDGGPPYNNGYVQQQQQPPMAYAPQHPMYHQHVQQQQQILLQQQQQHKQYQQQPIPNNNNNNDTNERFYQNLSVYRNQEVMHNGYSPQDKQMNQSQTSYQYDRSSTMSQKGFRGSQTSLQATRQSVDHIPAHLRERPTSAYLQKENNPPSDIGMAGRSQSSRDIMRSEAKLREMSEEVRRKELRDKANLQSYGGVQYQSVAARPPALAPGPGYPNHRQPAPYPNDMRSPTYPQNYANKTLYRTDEHGYRETPPPPPPPTSTHPLYQTTNSQRSPDNRYNASVGEPPRGGYYPSGANNSRHCPVQGTNPWEREEKEKEAERRRQAAKEWRDEQISELVALGANRNQSQEEQLRALRLEKEFERRVQEEEDDEEDDQETTERVQDLMRSVREKDDMRNVANNIGKPRGGQHSHMNGNIPSRSSYGQNNTSFEKERTRPKENKPKGIDIEPIRVDENRLKPKVEENNLNHFTTRRNPPPTTLKLDNGFNNSYNQLYNDHDFVTTQAPQQRLDTLLEHNSAPTPPERGSSFAIMSQALRSPLNTSSPRIDQPDPPPTNTLPKKVSFQENSIISSPIMGSSEKIMEDPNRFINEAESMLASPKSPDAPYQNCTPNVIGTQEVYKDPRQRRLAEQNQKLANNKGSTVPEKLTFKEKMKMFAMETGEEGTPRDKVKISRAQRDIDNLGQSQDNNNTLVDNTVN